MAATSSAGSSAQTGMVREAILDSSSATKARPDGDSGSHAIHAVDGLGQFSAAVVLTLSLRSLLTNCGWRQGPHTASRRLHPGIPCPCLMVRARSALM